MSESWSKICSTEQLIPNTGICALHNNEQVAIFLCGIEEALYAISNYCPFSKANVLSRGILGSIGESKVVASPIYKQRFCLTSGKCLEDDNVNVKTYEVRITDGFVELKS